MHELTALFSEYNRWRSLALTGPQVAAAAAPPANQCGTAPACTTETIMPVLEDCVQVISCTVNYTRHDVSCMRTHLGVCPLHSQPEGLELLGAHLLHVGHQVKHPVAGSTSPCTVALSLLSWFSKGLYFISFLCLARCGCEVATTGRARTSAAWGAQGF